MSQSNEIPNGFKKTEIGVIPEDWYVVGIVNLCNFVRGTEPGSKFYNRVDNGIPFIRVGNIAAKIQELVYTTSSNIKLCNEDDILISFDGSPGVVSRGMKGAYASGIRKVVIKTNKVEKEFIYYVLQTHYVQKTIEKYTTGITIKHASKSLPHIKIPLPPLPEQKKIAHVLSTIQEAKEKTQAVINAAKEFKKSLMKYLFTYGPVPLKEAENVKLKETEIGLIPEEWRIVKLGDVFEIQQGKALSPKSKKGVSPRPFIRTSNVMWGEIDLSHIDYMDFDENEIEKYVLKEGDLLVCEGGEIGRTAIWKDIQGIYCYQNHLHRLRPKIQNIYPLFIMYWMQAAFFLLNVYLGAGNVTTIPNLSRSRLSNFLTPFPPVSIQQKIASILSTVDEKIEKEENKKRALEELFKSMLHNLMSGKVRVKDLDIMVEEKKEEGKEIELVDENVGK